MSGPDREYAQGGYVGPGGDVPVILHPEECLLRLEADGSWRCVRPDHHHEDAS